MCDGHNSALGACAVMLPRSILRLLFPDVKNTYFSKSIKLQSIFAFSNYIFLKVLLNDKV